MENEQVQYLRTKLNEHFSFRGHLAVAYLDPETCVDPVDGLHKQLQRYLDSFAELNGCQRLGQHWRSIEESEATKTLEYLLTTSLCYSAEIMTCEMAVEFRTQFFELFEGSRKYFTSCTIPSEHGGHCEWVPLTRATFDAGVIVLWESCIAMLWVEDED